MKVWVESEYYLNLESEDKKWYKKKSTFSNGELLPGLNVSISLLLIYKHDFVISSDLLIQIQHHLAPPCW